MKIELKSIKHSKFASEETQCYEASLYVDGKKIGVVKNDGHGGSDYFYGDNAAFKAANAWAKTLPVEVVDLGNGKTFDLEQDVEMICHKILEAHLTSKELKTLLRRNVMFKDGESRLSVCRWTNTPKVGQQHFDHVQEAHPNAVILNTIAFDSALEIYIKN